MRFISLIALSLFLSAAQAKQVRVEVRQPSSLSPKKVHLKECQFRPRFLSYTRTEIAPGVNHLPKVLLVANRIEQYIDGTNRTSGKPFQLYWNYSLTQKKSEPEVCGQASDKEIYQLGFTAPTLLDLSPKQDQGNSFWRFETAFEGTEVSLWNRPMKLLGERTSPLSLEKDINGEFRFFQLSQRQLELFIQKDIDGVQNYLSIIFDIIPEDHR